MAWFTSKKQAKIKIMPSMLEAKKMPPKLAD
jgi:hypothetical protein